MRSRFHIRAYAWFKDDLLIVIGGDANPRRRFYHALQAKAIFFRLKVESISRSSVEMLDIILYKGNRHRLYGILDHVVRIRTSALGIALSDTSCHPAGAHRTWPLARLRTIKLRCSDVQGSEAACNAFKNVLLSSCPSHVAFDPLCVSQSVHSSSFCKLSSWVVMPHHPVLEKCGIPALLRRVFERYEVSLTQADEYIDDLRARVAWSLGGASLKSKLLALNRVGNISE